MTSRDPAPTSIIPTSGRTRTCATPPPPRPVASTSRSARMPDPGDVVIVDFPGAVQRKRRPAVIISSGGYHAQRPDIIVGAITSNIARSTATTDHVLIDWQAAGLRVPSAFRVYLLTFDKSEIIRHIGRVSAADWASIQACVRIALAV